MEDDWIVESFISHLKCPLWVFQVDNFIEQRCIVFDEVGTDDVAYDEIHAEYQAKIESLVEGFVEDLSVSVDLLIFACGKSKTVGQAPESIFRPLLACQNFELFKSTMFQKNVELELQAVDILEKQLGKSLDIYRRCQLPVVSSQEKQRAMEEDILLQETLQKTSKESNSKDEELKMDKHLKQILEEVSKFEEQKKELKKRASLSCSLELQDTIEAEEEEPVASGGVEETPESEQVDLAGEDEVDEWALNSLGCNLEVVTPDMYRYMPPIVKALMEHPDEPTVKQRYLMYQRTRIVENKRMIRAKKMKEYIEAHPTIPRPDNLVPSAFVPPKMSDKCAAEDLYQPAVDTDPEQEDELESSVGAEVCGWRHKMAPLANRKSAILSDIVSRKLREERKKE